MQSGINNEYNFLTYRSMWVNIILSKLNSINFIGI